MLKGIAKAGGDEAPEDRYGIVVALSNLSKTVADAQSGPAFAAAAETGATLLRVPKAAVFVKAAGGDVVVGGSAGIDEDDEDFVSAAGEIAQDAIISSGPIVHPNVSAQEEKFARKLAKSNVASVICVPMRVGETNVGAIVAMSEHLRAFSPSDVELLHVVASQAALAAWRSGSSSLAAQIETKDQDDLIRLAQRKIQDLSLINQVSEEVSSTLVLDKLLEIALRQSMTVVEADVGSLMLINEETNKLEIAASRGLDRKWVETTSQQIGTSIAGWVAEHGESVLVRDAHRDSRFRMTVFRDSITSAASVPLRTKGGIIGALNVNTVQPGKSFDERDLAILGTVANQMAVAIENARLYGRVNRRTDQLDSLLQIAKTVTSTLNLDEVLRRLSDEICKLFGLEVCVLLVLDEVSGRFRFGRGSGLRTKRKSTYFDLAAPAAARVRKSGKKLVLRDISSSKSLRTAVSDSEGLKATVCVPLKNHGKLVGVAAGFAREARSFPKSQMGIITRLGELAGVAVHNARVYRRKYKMAELLQQRLGSVSIPKVPGLDIGHKFLPAREVGGDYYDFMDVGRNRIGIVVADVSGSDIEAAEYTTMGKHVLRAYAREYQSPAEVLAKTNDLICEDTRDEMFISLFYGVIDTKRMTLEYANAGCEPPILRRSNGKVSRLVADGILLGIKKGMRFEERRVKLKTQDAVVIYTDGLPEAEVDSKRFGSDPVVEVVSANARFTAQRIADRIHDALLEFAHGRVTDDVAVVVLKVL